MALRQALRDVFADRYATATMIGAVVLYSVFYPAAYRHEVTMDLPVAVVDQDHGPMSRGFVRRLDAVRTVRIAGVEPSVAAARRGLERGRYEGIVVIPHGFERDVARGTTARLAVLANGAYLGRGSSVVAAVHEVAGATAADAAADGRRFGHRREAPPVALIQRPLFNTREGYGSGMVPGVAEIIVHQTLVVGTGVILGGRRQRNGGRRLRYRFAEWTGMLAGFACIGLPALLYYAGFTFWVQDYPRGGNPAALAVVAPLYVAAILTFGLFLGSFFSRREHAFQFVIGTSIVLFSLSNLTWPLTSTPPALAALAKLLPTTPGVNALVKVNQMGASVSETLPQIVNLSVLVALYACLAAWRFRPGSSARGRAGSSAIDPNPKASNKEFPCPASHPSVSSIP
ncbi:ABC transporter permease [Luteimonas sp. BDR2-5]|uniref:ABC transporter permease n=1 Tax=Proluteimonas luteida TaxID=2878685 RepID=UPI001E5A42D9|nr:ABC transporter permease [Luteimonas sp. BDR2-5]MCD9026798.1 ABC transporter permease [Luteimonas sp. BDR2-5]